MTDTNLHGTITSLTWNASNSFTYNIGFAVTKTKCKKKNNVIAEQHCHHYNMMPYKAR